jgi:hypothetical protein
MNSVRAWVFRVLVLIVAATMVASFVKPWWTCHLHTLGLDQSVGKDLEIFAWGFRPDVYVLKEYVAADITPLRMVRLAWGYLVVSVVLALASTWLKGGKGRLLLALVGLVCMVYAVAGILWIRQRTWEGFGIRLQGYSYIPEQAGINVDARVLLGYYLAPVSGALFVLLALLRNLIVGKPKPGAP